MYMSVSEPNTDSEVLGKLYNNSAATVLETTEDGWYKITSGSVTGYVKCEYVVTGDDELCKEGKYQICNCNNYNFIRKNGAFYRGRYFNNAWRGRRFRCC